MSNLEFKKGDRISVVQGTYQGCTATFVGYRGKTNQSVCVALDQKPNPLKTIRLTSIAPLLAAKEDKQRDEDMPEANKETELRQEMNSLNENLVGLSEEIKDLKLTVKALIDVFKGLGIHK